MKRGANPGFIFESTKTYVHSVGLSCCFRQWRATESHCRFLHGYALEVKLTFQADILDERNWVMDFGGLKPIKVWLEEKFDHKLLVAYDDPERDRIVELAGTTEELWRAKIADVIIVEDVGCEAFAKMIFNHVNDWYQKLTGYEIHRWLQAVEVREHAGNSAIYRRT